jgi:hypothetical protein
MSLPRKPIFFTTILFCVIETKTFIHLFCRHFFHTFSLRSIIYNQFHNSNFSSIFNGLRHIGGKLWQGINYIFANFWSGLKYAGNAIANAHYYLWQALKNAVVAVFEGLKNIVLYFYDCIASIFSITWMAIRYLGLMISNFLR